MFYVPLALRSIETPKGPDFADARPVSVNLGGSKVTLRLPKHNPIFAEKAAVHRQESINLYGSETYTENVGPWQMGVPLHRAWRFCGPWFAGALAELDLVMIVNHRQFSKESDTLFNGNVFEREVLEWLALECNKDQSEWGVHWQAPLNWQVHTHLPVFSVSFDALPSDSDSARKELVFPIADDCLVSLNFQQDQRLAGTQAQKDNLIDRSSTERLCVDIINNIQLELSPDATRQWQRAQKDKASNKLSENVPAISVAL